MYVYLYVVNRSIEAPLCVALEGTAAECDNGSG